MKHHNCCYYECDRPGVIFVGENCNADAQWICEYHRDKWNADRSRVIAKGLPCQMQEI